MFGLLSRNLPRVRKGQPLPASALNRWPDAAERARLLPGSGDGLELTQLPGGTGVRQTRIAYAYVCRATSTISAASGLTYQTGSAVVQEDTGSALADGATTLPVVKSYHDKTIATGSIIFVAFAIGSWWVIDVQSCTDLS